MTELLTPKNQETMTPEADNVERIISRADLTVEVDEAIRVMHSAQNELDAIPVPTEISSESIEELNSLNTQAKAEGQEATRNIEVELADHPLYEILADPALLKNISPEQLEILTKETVEKRKSDKSFQSELSSLLSDESVTAFTESNEGKISAKEAKTKLLQKYCEESKASGEFLNAQETATLLYEFKNLGAFEDVIKVYEQSDSTIFADSPVIKEFVAVAYNKTGRLNEAKALAEELMVTGNGKVGECAGILGKIYKLEAQNAETPQEKTDAMQKSVDSLEKGFSETFEFYPGINLVYNQIELGVMTNNASLVEKAIKTSGFVEMSAIKAGGLNSADYWTVTTLLESAVISGQDTDAYLEKTLQLGQHEWELKAPIDNLTRLRGSLSTLLGQEGVSEEVKSAVSRIILNSEIIINQLQTKVDNLESGVKDEVKTQTEKSVTEKVLESGFTYGETTTFVGGNIEFGGQLQSHMVNRFDVGVANSIIQDLGLEKVDDFEQFNTAIDDMIRSRYETAPLEDLHSAEHGAYDTEIKNLLTAMGIDKNNNELSADSRTNIMVDFYLGKGDCRQHAHTKQLLFDCWKTTRINEMMSSLYKSEEKGIPSDQQEGLRVKIDQLLKTKMLVFDSMVEAQIKMDGLYSPTMKDGKTIADENYHDVEEHTWNGLVTLDENGQMQGMRMVDSFYQNEYQFGSPKEVIAADPSGYIDGGMSAGTVKTYDNEGNPVEVPVRLRPTVYAGDREKRVKRSDDIGGAKLRGIDIAQFSKDQEGKIDTKGFFSQEATYSIGNFWKTIREPDKVVV